jgi:hypothetical protein
MAGVFSLKHPIHMFQPPNSNIPSNYKGSETTFERVQQQIRERWGDIAAAEYDPLHNCLTFRQWLKAGYCVKRGEKAIRSITIIEKKDEKGELVGKYPKTVFLFFREQVEPLKNREMAEREVV